MNAGKMRVHSITKRKIEGLYVLGLATRNQENRQRILTLIAMTINILPGDWLWKPGGTKGITMFE